MGSTDIVNRTSKALDVQIGNCRHFVKLAMVEKNRSHRVHVNCNDTYMEFSLGVDSRGNPLIVSSDDCVDNRAIIVREVDGRFHVEMQPRVVPTVVTTARAPRPKKWSSIFWRLWIV